MIRTITIETPIDEMIAGATDKFFWYKFKC